MNETVANENAEKVPGWNLLSKASTESLRVQARITSPHVAQIVDMAQIARKSASPLARCQQLVSRHPMQHQNAHRLQIAPLSLSTIVADNNVALRDSLHALAQ